jgi:hypothetical protein
MGNGSRRRELDLSSSVIIPADKFALEEKAMKFAD